MCSLSRPDISETTLTCGLPTRSARSLSTGIVTTTLNGSVVRDGKRVSQLDPAAVRVIEKEDESEERIYDGERTALLFLNDVRPGDVLDYSWSLEGSNPLLGGKYDDQDRKRSP